MRRSALRRGAALLLVLAALVLGMSAAVVAARVATDSTLLRNLDLGESIADDAGRAVNARIEDWLCQDSGNAVAPVDATEPAVPVMTCRIATGDTEVAIRITAYDQHGMVPWTSAFKDDAIARSALPDDVRDAIGRSKVPKGVPPGIDLASSSADHAHFPRHPDMPVVEFGPVKRFANSRTNDDGDQHADSLATLVATHLEGPARINVNTAPMPLIEAAERLTQRSVSGAVRAARTEGRRASIPAGATGTRADTGAQFVGSSDTWSFRIDIDVGPVCRSWWATYKDTGEGWACVQRLRIES